MYINIEKGRMDITLDPRKGMLPHTFPGYPGAVKIGKKERALKNGREQGERGKMSKGVGSIDPP